MKVLVVGGGSGGHITPAVAVVRELLEKTPRTKVEFWTDRKYYKNVVKITTEIGVRWGSRAQNSNRRVPYIRVRKIWAGKFHRYANWTWQDWFRNWQIVIKDLIFGNIVGFFGFIGGIIQSFFRLLLPSKRPDVIFLKGGFVGLPVGIIARRLKIPYVVHESDMVPGLANRILMEHATVVASGWEGLKSDNAHVVHVGVPVAPEFKEVTEAQQKTLKKDFGFDPERPLVVITGGSQGSQNINEAVHEILPEMLKFTSVGLVAGRKYYEEIVDLKQYEEWDKAKLQSNFRMWEFNSAMHELMGAADVVVSRAGATTVAELSALSKAVILIPFEKLPGSHQLKNAEKLVEMGAVVMIPDAKMRKNPQELLDAVRHLVRAPRERQELADKLHAEAKPDAAARLAQILIDVSEHQEEIRAEQKQTRKATKIERRETKKAVKLERKATKQATRTEHQEAKKTAKIEQKTAKKVARAKKAATKHNSRTIKKLERQSKTAKRFKERE